VMMGVFLFVVGFMLLFAAVMIALNYYGVIGPGGGRRQRLASPEDTLRERYVRGEVARQAYLDALSDVLKDRYVRGELTTEEYEERLGVLLSDVKSITDKSGQRRLPPSR
jgi:uncharacterized membrane protein